EGFGFDLSDALTRDFEVLSDFFEGVIVFLADAEAHAKHLFFSRSKSLEHFASLVTQVQADDRLRGVHGVLVFDEVAQVAIVFLTNRSLKADRLLGDLEYLPDFIERKLHLLCYFFRSGFATEF